MYVGIVAQRGNDRAAYLADAIRSSLLASGIDVRLDSTTAESLGERGAAVEGMDDATLVVSIGGDGTFLYTARCVGHAPILGVNLGEVGFLNAVSPTEAVDVVTQELERYRETGRLRVQDVSRVEAHGDGWRIGPALNEIVVHAPQRGRGQGFTAEVRVGGKLYTGGHADGVIVSTPVGSTAYNLSERGPLLTPDIDGIVVTEMCATDPMPSLVVAPGSDVTVRVDDASFAFVVTDGRTKRRMDVPGRVSIGLADEPVRIAGPPVDFFDALSKLD